MVTKRFFAVKPTTELLRLAKDADVLVKPELLVKRVSDRQRCTMEHDLETVKHVFRKTFLHQLQLASEENVSGLIHYVSSSDFDTCWSVECYDSYEDVDDLISDLEM